VGIAGVILLTAYIVQRSMVYGNLFLPFLDPYVLSPEGYVFYPAMILFIPFLFFLTKDSKIDRQIGNLSFSIYLLGTPVVELTLFFGNQYPHLKNYIHNNISVLVITIALAICIYLTIEKPIEVIRRRRVEKNKVQDTV
jgi:peptidoglycan/LPS O-acetylase OafA/YrhL